MNARRAPLPDGRPDPAHAAPGRYCIPAGRCYCGQCPQYQPLHGETMTDKHAVDLDTPAAGWVQAYRAAEAQEKHWAEVKKKARQQLEDTLGAAEEGRVDGRTIVRWTYVESSRFDSAKFKADAPEAFAAYSKPSITRRFTVAGDD